jgi:hypothetical protein
MIREAIDAVKQDKDPAGVFRSAHDPIIFDSSRDEVEALT